MAQNFVGKLHDNFFTFFVTPRTRSNAQSPDGRQYCSITKSLYVVCTFENCFFGMHKVNGVALGSDSLSG